MTNKLFSFLLLFALAVGGIGLSGLKTAYAAVPTYPAGCLSPLGYSSVTHLPCNGTANNPYLVTLGPADPGSATLGLPRTGSGGNAPMNILLLVSSGLLAALGSVYLLRRSQLH